MRQYDEEIIGFQVIMYQFEVLKVDMYKSQIHTEAWSQGTTVLLRTESANKVINMDFR